jgi:hypothetical protein
MSYSCQLAGSSLVTYQAETVHEVWNQVKGYIQRALDRGSNVTLDEIREGLGTGKYQLWTSQNGDIEAALITSIQTDLTTFCLLLAAGGSNMKVWKHWMPILEEWAKEHGCTELRIYGRSGWARAAGFDIAYMRREL